MINKKNIKFNGKILKIRWTWVGLEPTRFDVLSLLGDSSLH